MWKGVSLFKLQKKILFQEYNVFYYETGHCLRFCTGKIAYKYYT